MPSGSDNGYPMLPHHGVHTFLLLLTLEVGWKQGLVRTRGLVGTRMLICGTPSWEGWGCYHMCSCSWVARLSSGPAPREASNRENKSRNMVPAHFGSMARCQAGGHAVPDSMGEHSMMSPLQHWVRGAGSGLPSHPPFPFLHLPWHILGGGQQKQGWPCVPST